MSVLTPVHFRVPSVIFGLLVAKYFVANEVPELFEKLLPQFISYLGFTHMGWVSLPLYIFVFLASFSALWWPNIWPNMGFAELFGKTIGSIHFTPVIYLYGISFLTPIHFRVPSLIFDLWWPNIWPNMGFPELRKLLAKLISYLEFILMGWVSWPLYIFVFLASFSGLWWPNFWPKTEFPELFEKTIGSIHFIPGICPYGVSVLTTIHFRVPSLIFGPLVAKYLADYGVSGTF